MRDSFINMIQDALVEAAAVDVDDLSAQVCDISSSIAQLMTYRDKCPRGSSRRADFVSSISRLKDWQKRLQKKIDNAVEASPKKKKKLTEGGLGGHLMHLYDNWDLTFADIKEVIRHAEQGKLENITEKTDGQNIFISWDVGSNQLKAARNKGNIKTGGLDADGLASKFAGRGSVYDAFVNGFNVITKAISALSSQEKLKIFGANANIWYSVEIMFTSNPNVVNYDKNNIVFHEEGSANFDKDTGNATDDDISTEFQMLVAAVDKMKSNIGDDTWNVMGPPIRRLQAMQNGEHARDAEARLDSVMSSAGVSDNDTIATYIRNMLERDVLGRISLPDDKKDAIIKRVMGEKSAPTATQIQAGLTPDVKKQVAEILQSKTIMQTVISPIEDIIHDFAVEVLRDMESVFVADRSKEVQRVRDEVTTAIEAIEASNNENAMAILNAQLRKLRGVENISFAGEGIVFAYKGNAYKFTGNFAPVNQILGLFKYGRSGIPPIKKTNENRVNNMVELIKHMLNEKKREELTTPETRPKEMTRPFPPPANIWISWSKNNPKKYNPKEAGMNAIAGVGPGEEMLAWEFGGQVQGGNTSYDISIGTTKIEVKAADESKTSIVIRAGTKGTRAISDIKHELDKALHQLKKMMKKYREFQSELDLSYEDAEALENVMGFVVNDVDSILGGELAKEKIIRSPQAIKANKPLALWDVFHIMHDVLSEEEGTHRPIALGGRETSVNMRTYMALASQLGIEKVENTTPADILRGMLTHYAFENPKLFMLDFFAGIDPQLVFGGTDGMVLVKPHGYFYIPAAQYSSVLEFYSISQNRPKFKVVI